MSAQTPSWVGADVSGGRYRVLALLGEGGMGLVYRARDRNLGCDVVLKAPRRAMLDDPEFAPRFAREVRSLVHLAHPHIVRITDVGVHEGVPFAVMQYLSGGALDDRRSAGEGGRPGPAEPGTLGDWLPAIAGALDFVHGKGYLHRDVKPANILFDDQGHAYLSDFGVAKALAKTSEAASSKASTATGMVIGTPEYMAPELIMGRPADGSADQYALATALYELLCGRRPFVDENSTAVLVRQAVEAPPDPRIVCPSLHASIAVALLRGLAKDPADRFPTCRSLATAVMEGARDQAVRGAPVIATGDRKRLACPSCGKRLKLDPALSGKRARCPSCGTRFQVAGDLGGLMAVDQRPEGTTVLLQVPAELRPGRGSATASAPAPPQVTPRLAGAPEKPTSAVPRGTGAGARVRRSTPALIGLAVVVLSVFVLGGLFAMRSLGRKVQPEPPAVGKAAEPRVAYIPVLAAIPNQVIEQGGSLALTVGTETTHPPTVALEYALGPDAPAGATIDPLTGVFTWTPGPEHGVASYSITVKVSVVDRPQDGHSRTFGVRINQPARAAELADVGDRVIGAGRRFTLTATAATADPGRRKLTYSLAPGAPDGARIDPLTGVFTWTPPLSLVGKHYPITIRASDGIARGPASSVSFGLTVNSGQLEPGLITWDTLPPPGELSWPSDIVVNSAGEIFIGDSGSGRIQVIDADGRFLRIFGSKGIRPGQFRSISRIAVDAEDNIYVADSGLERISVWTRIGEFRRVWETPCVSMAIHSALQRLYVLDGVVIHVKDFQGNEIASFRTPTRPPPRVSPTFEAKHRAGLVRQSQPNWLAVDQPSGRLFVLNCKPYVGSVAVFDSAGQLVKFLTHFGSSAFLVPQFIVSDPSGSVSMTLVDVPPHPFASYICKLSPSYEVTDHRPFAPVTRSVGFQSYLLTIDHQGRLITADRRECLVKRLNSDHSVNFQWGKPTKTPGQLQRRMSIAVSPSDRVYVLDAAARYVRVFEKDGSFLRAFNCATGADGSGNANPATPAEDAGLSAFAVDGGDNLYVLDLAARTVQQFDPRGEPTRNQSLPADRPGLEVSEKLGDLAIDATGRLAVLDGPTSMLITFDSGFDRPATIVLNDGHGNALPGGSVDRLAIAKDGTIYVARATGQSVELYSKEGRCLGTLGGQEHPVRFQSVRCLRVDARDHLHVLETDRIREFDRNGRLLRSWATQDANGARVDQFSSIAVNDQTIFGCNVENQSVETLKWE